MDTHEQVNKYLKQCYNLVQLILGVKIIDEARREFESKAQNLISFIRIRAKYGVNEFPCADMRYPDKMTWVEGRRAEIRL